MFKSWKTTLIGIALIAFGGYVAIHDNDNATGTAIVLAGIGLVGAKDSNATHTKP